MKRTRFALSAFFGTFTAAAQVVGLSYGGRPSAKEFDPIPVRCICPEELAQIKAEGARLAASLMLPTGRAVVEQWSAGVIHPASPEKAASYHDTFGYQEQRADYGYNVFADLAVKHRLATVSIPPQRDEVAPSWSPLEEKFGDIFDYLPKGNSASAQAQQAAPAQQPVSSRRQATQAPAGYAQWNGFDGHGYPYVDHSLKRGPIHAVTRMIGGGGDLAAARGPLGGSGNLGAAAGPIGSQSALGNNAPLGAGGPLSSSGPLSSHGILSGVGPLTGTGPLSGIGNLSGNGNLQGNGPLTGQGSLNGGGILGGGGGPLGGGSTAPLGDGAGVLRHKAGPAPAAEDKLQRDLADLGRYLDGLATIDEAMRINLANDGIHGGQWPVVEKVAPKAAANVEAAIDETCPGQVLDVDTADDTVSSKLCPLAAEADPFVYEANASATAADTADYEYDDTYGIYDDAYPSYEVSMPAAPAYDPCQVAAEDEALADETDADSAADEAAGPSCRDEALGNYHSSASNGCYQYNHCPYTGSYRAERYDDDYASVREPLAAAPAPTSAGSVAADADGPVEAPPVEASSDARGDYSALDAAYEDYGLYGYDGFDDYGYDIYGYDSYDGNYDFSAGSAGAEEADVCEEVGYCDEADMYHEAAQYIDDCLGDEADLDSDLLNSETTLLHGPEYDCYHERTAADEAPVAAPAPGPEYYQAANQAMFDAAAVAVENFVAFVHGMQEELHALATEFGQFQVNHNLAADADLAVNVEKADFAPATGNQFGPALPSPDEQLRPMPRELPSFVFPAEFDLGI